MEVENRKRSDTIPPDQPPAHKKHRADGPSYSFSWEGKSSKVCIPLFCYGNTINDRECNVCVVDLSANCGEETNGVPRSPPTFKIKYVPDGVKEPDDLMDGFCGLGNRVYIFEASYHKETKAVYYIDISDPLEFASQTLFISNLPKIGEMRSAKYNPSAVVVPNTCKILVFPSLLFRKGKGVMSNILGGFELFDTVDGSSQELPSIELNAPIRGCRVEAYGFIDTHRFSVQILIEQIYVLDLDSLDKGWVPTANTLLVDRVAANSLADSTSFEVVESRFCFRTCGGIRDLHLPVVKEVEEEYEPCYLWLLSNVILHMNSPQYFLTLLSHDEQAGESCICRLTVDTCQRQRSKKSIPMQFDVAVLDLKRYKQELDLPGSSTTDYSRFVKSLRYSLNLPGPQHKVLTNRTFFSF